MSSARNAKTAIAFARLWHHVDCTGRVLGRLASQIAHVLQGKHKPIYHPADDCGDYVVVTNARSIMLTGEKAVNNKYVYYTGFPGGQKHMPIKRLRDLNPQEIIRHAVYGMLPKNKTRRIRMNRLKIFPGPIHPYEANIFKSYMPAPIPPVPAIRPKGLMAGTVGCSKAADTGCAVPRE